VGFERWLHDSYKYVVTKGKVITLQSFWSKYG